MTKYIHEYEKWTEFRWNKDVLAPWIEKTAREQGHLLGCLGLLGKEPRLQTASESLIKEVYATSEIEGIHLNIEQIRSSVEWKIGTATAKAPSASHYVDSVVNVVLSALHVYDEPISKDKICSWQAGFFPTGVSEGHIVETGRYRTFNEKVVSGFLGRERVHYVAPEPERVEAEMERYIEWFNAPSQLPWSIRSAIAHLWFVCIHPFEDGNGRLGRLLGEIMLARSDGNALRYYNMSSAINSDKRHYYEVLERTSKGDGDITQWLVWYLQTLHASLVAAHEVVRLTMAKGAFWIRAASVHFNERQTLVLNTFLDGYEAKITAKTWADLGRCSRDTATRDLAYLMENGVLLADIPGAKRPSYSINYALGEDPASVSGRFGEAYVEKCADGHYILHATLPDGTRKSQVIQQLEGERYMRSDLPLGHLLIKYFPFE